METGCSRSPRFPRSKARLLAAALAASIAGPAWAGQALQAPPAAEPRPEGDIAAVRAFLTAVEADRADARELLAGAARAEPLIQSWPASLPDRETVRAIIAFAQAEGNLIRAFRANSPLQANLMPLMEQVTTAADRIDSRHAPRAWANAQLGATELMLPFFSMIRAGLPPSQSAAALTRMRERIEGFATDEARFTPVQRARLWAAIADAYAPVPNPTLPQPSVNTIDVTAGLDLYRRAWRTALGASATNLARDYLIDAATATLRRDPTGAEAEALLAAEAGSGPADWLRRRSVYQLRMRIAESRGDQAVHDAQSELWMSALTADLRAARAPFWAAGIASDAQMSYLAAPLRRGDPATTLARLDRLAEATRTEGEADLPGLPETSPGEPPPPAAAPPSPGSLGVDLIAVAVAGPMNAMASDVFMRAATGNTERMDPAASIDWGALSAGSGRPRSATTRSDVDPRLPIVEMGRGFASAMPSLLQAMGMPALTGAQAAAFRDGMAGQIPAFETHFFTAFGKPLDDLAGGRCASNQPLSGAAPRILLILPASLSFFPIEMARAPNGRRLIDCYEIRRAPTLAAARQSAARWSARGRPLRGIAGVWNPQGDLRNAGAERPLIAAAAGPGAIVPLDATSAATILRPAGGAEIVHIAGHGRLGLLDPFDSSVAVGPGRLLTFREIVRASAPTTARLIVLSACEAGLSTPQSGEAAYWGMSSAFLSAGAGGVVGPLWQIRDDAAALIMGKFYELMLRRGRPPAAALREAQLWLRDASAIELMRFVDDSARNADAAGRESLDSLRGAISGADERTTGAAPYADPMLWGGFGYFGTYPGN